MSQYRMAVAAAVTTEVQKPDLNWWKIAGILCIIKSTNGRCRKSTSAVFAGK